MTVFLPTSIELFKLITLKLNDIKDVFQPHSAELKKLKALVLTKENILTSPDFLTLPSIISYIQILLLMNLVKEKNINELFILRIIEKENIVTITWANQTYSKFTFGRYDENCQKFFNDFKRNALKYYQKETGLSIKTFYFLKENLQGNVSLLDHTQKQLQSILMNVDNLTMLLDSPANFTSSLLFILISSLPHEQLNALLMHVQQHFPDDLEVVGSTGDLIKIDSLFQTTTTDIKFLLEKVKIYLHLYANVDMPIIARITQEETKKFLLELLKNTEIKKMTMQNIQNALEQQFINRIFLYLLFLNHLNALLSTD